MDFGGEDCSGEDDFEALLSIGRDDGVSEFCGGALRPALAYGIVKRTSVTRWSRLVTLCQAGAR